MIEAIFGFDIIGSHFVRIEIPEEELKDIPEDDLEAYISETYYEEAYYQASRECDYSIGEMIDFEIEKN